jgi:predicted DNA-binding transcriptional regulator AlpA
MSTCRAHRLNLFLHPSSERGTVHMLADQVKLLSGEEDESYFLDIGAVCTFFGGSRPLSPSTIYRLVKAGRLPPPVSIGGSSRWIQTECAEARKKMVNQRTGTCRDGH